MSSTPGHQRAVTELLRDAGREASLARRLLAGDRASHRIAPTELVHGAALKLMAQDHVSARDRSHFLAYAGQVTRQVLIDEVHREGAEKCGPTRITLF